MLALDLGVMNRRSHRVGFREALAWSGIWIALAAAFAVLVFFWHGRAEALQFTTAYIIELSLSVDNLFVFLLIFRYFKVQSEHEHKVLVWGILGALVMRGLFIAAGVSLLHRFHWITYVFGALLVYSGVKLLSQGEAQIHPEKNLVLRAFRRIMPVTDDYVGGHFFTRRDVLCATPLFIVLLVIETSDVLFAVDSIPAVLAVTLNAFIVYTSNVFAILGLRSMYFAVSRLMKVFRFLHYGLAAMLVLGGWKMLTAEYFRIPTRAMLGCISGVILFSIAISAAFPASESKGQNVT